MPEGVLATPFAFMPGMRGVAQGNPPSPSGLQGRPWFWGPALAFPRRNIESHPLPGVCFAL